LRRNLGQFLSRYSPAQIGEGLTRVKLRHEAGYAAEAACLLGWVRKGLVRGGAELSAPGYVLQSGQGEGSFALVFDYTSPEKSFRWHADLAANHAEFIGELGAGRTTLSLGAHLLSPEMALAEAMFF